MTEDIDITVRTRLYRTESRKKVEEAVRNLFPDAEFEDSREGENGGGDNENGDERDEDIELVAHAGGDSVEYLRELIDRQEINEAAHEQLKEAILGDTLAFSLSKQPATVGRVNFDVGGHELGALHIRIETDDTEALIERLTTPS
jgi:hypothetical protein